AFVPAALVTATPTPVSPIVVVVVVVVIIPVAASAVVDLGASAVRAPWASSSARTVAVASLAL
ncbi:MAG: hypothetical protein KC657_13420, partial [Myxococcales bacterium]|nr:hypothetical protein [Myxococcales bacterium]